MKLSFLIFVVKILGNRELWQWIHYSYGEDLGLTSNDEDSYRTISMAERITFQLRLPQGTKSNQSFSNSVAVKVGTNKRSQSFVAICEGI